MQCHARNRPRFSLGGELLESRALLNAHLPHPDFAHVTRVAETVHVAFTGTRNGNAPDTILLNSTAQSLLGESEIEISGSLYGTAPYTTDAGNSDSGSNSYSVSGRTSSGPAKVVGLDYWVLYPMPSSHDKEVYYDGNWTMDLDDGSTVAISYVGTDEEPTGNGRDTAHLRGEAIGTSGSLLGDMFSFAAKATRNKANGLVAVIFELKPSTVAATQDFTSVSAT